jgi:tRNA (adenine-N(1)-)-methyltransferase non-catalytic subunit
LVHLYCHLGKVNNTEEIKEGQFQAESKDGQLYGESKDNRSLIDNNTAQSLTGEDIEDMRR